LGYPHATGEKIAKLLPPPTPGFPITIPKALSETQELKNIYDTDKDAKKILDLAMQIEGNARHISVHAAGVVVSPSILTDFTPIQREPSGEKIITQYEMHACEDVGLIKFDILGIRNLTILGESIRLVKELENTDIELLKIPLDDKKTYTMLGKGETMGVFQLSSSGMTKYLKELKPTKLEDIMAMVALYRPGPIDVIPEYIKRKKDPKLVKFLDPRMKRFLEASYGLIVYQDDLLFCAIDLAGYTWEEADKFRKAVGKKIPEEMAAQKEKFINGIIKNGQSDEFAEHLWQLFEPFQAYGFNKAHAASYGTVAYYTAYMKANYPNEYMCSLLTAESNDKDKVSLAINECRRMGIEILPPDINESVEGFRIVEDKKSLNSKAIRFGLNAIKNVGDAAICAILEARMDGPFSDIYDFLLRSDGRKVNKKVLESLIKVGAFKKFASRTYLLNNIDSLKEKAQKAKKEEAQAGLFSMDEIKTQPNMSIDPNLYQSEDFDETEIQNLERELLGLSLSAKPIGEVLDEISKFASHRITEINEELASNDVKIAGVIKEVRVIVTKKTGAEMAFVKLEDISGIIELVVFPSTYNEVKEILTETSPLLIKGKVNLREENLSVIVENISKGSEATKDESGEVFIHVPKEIERHQLLKLKEFLLSNKGNNKATLIFEKNKSRVKLSFGISWNSKVAKGIEKILNTHLIS